MSVRRATMSVRRLGRRAPRRLNATLAELLRTRRPIATAEGRVWVCITPTTATAIARVAARRAGVPAPDCRHPAFAAARQPVQVCAATAAQWRLDAWQAADEGLIGVADAQALAAQIDPPGVC